MFEICYTFMPFYLEFIVWSKSTMQIRATIHCRR